LRGEIAPTEITLALTDLRDQPKTMQSPKKTGRPHKPPGKQEYTALQGPPEKCPGSRKASHTKTKKKAQTKEGARAAVGDKESQEA